MLIAPTGPRVGPGHPLQRHSALHHSRVSLSGSLHGLGRKRETQNSDIILRALPSSAGPVREPEEPHRVHEGARQLLGVSALAFFSFLAIVVKDRATSPIIPPLLPTLTVSTGDAGSSSTKPGPVRATAENPDAGSTSSVKNRGLLRAVWGMATAPVKLVDSLLFPEEALVGSKAQQAAAPTAVSTSAPAPKQAKAGRHAAAPAAAAADSISAAVPEAAPAAAAAGEALTSLSDRVSALASAMPHAAAVSPASSTSSQTPDFLVQLQEAVSRLVSTQQQQQQQQASAQDEAAPVQDADSSADAAAALAALRMLVGPDAMSLLPVLLVTAATAAAGLMLASAMAGVAGLVDKRQAMTPAQRSAQAALLDSPLRPIVCQTWPGFLPMLPSSIEPNYYRWRDTDGPTAAPGSSSSSSSSSSVSGAAAAASATAAGPKEHPLDQEWWSFAQIQALRLMPELTNKFGSGNSNSGGSTAASQAPTSTSTNSAAAGTATGAGAATAAAVDAAAAAAPTSARSFERTKDSLLEAATAAAEGDADLLAALDGSSSTDGAVLLGEAWELALQLAAVDSLASPDTAWDLTHGFGAGAPTQLLAEVVCLLPAAVVAVRAGASAGCPDWQVGSISCWEQASLLICMLLDPATTGLGRLQAVCEAIGVVGTAAAPDVLQGVLQEHCQHLLCQTAEAEAIPDLTYGRVPGLEAFLQRGKQQRVRFAAAALNSSIMAASVAAELWGEAVGEHAASAASPSAAAAAAAAAADGVAWEQPRTVLLHAQLLHELLHDVLPAGIESLGPLAADLLDRSNEATGELNFHALQLLATQAGPGVGPVTAADAALHKQIHAAASASGVLEAALRPVSAAAEWSEEDQGVADTVVAVMELSVLAVKLPETPALFKLRPAWPAAQQLAILDSMLLPSASAKVLGSFAAAHGHPSMLAANTVLPGMLTLLPAAVVNVRSFLQQRLPAAGPDSVGQASSEDATDACLRMYRCMLSTAAKEHRADGYFWVVLSRLGLEPAAVAAAVDAVREDWSNFFDDVVEKVDDASRAAYSPVVHFAGGLLPALPCSSDERLDAAARPALALSCTVCLSLLLHLGDTEGWVDVEFTPSKQKYFSDAYNWPPETRSSLALLAAEYAGSSVFELPGSEAAAAVLLALHQQLQRSPGARPMSKFAVNTPEQLLAGEDDSHLICHVSWAAGMAAALALPEGMDLGGDEQWRERQDYSSASWGSRLPYSLCGPEIRMQLEAVYDAERVSEPEWGAGNSSSDEEAVEGWQQQQDEEEEEEDVEEEDVEEEQDGSPPADKVPSDWEAAMSDEELESGHSALQGYFAQLEEAGLVTPTAVCMWEEMSECVSAETELAFQAAVYTASVVHRAGEEVAAEKLRELSSTAPSWVVVKLCTLLPRAVVQYRVAALADPESAAGEDSSLGSWEHTARLMAAVLAPAAAACAADEQGASRKGQAAVKGGSRDGQAQGKQQSKQQKRKQRKKRQRKDRGEGPAQAAQLQGEEQEPAAPANGRVSTQGPAAGAVEPVVEGKQEGGAPECELIPTVKKLLGLPVDPSDSALSNADAVPNRLALLLCQAMLMRGDDAQAKLQAAVGYLATAATQAPCSEAVQVQVPSMLCNCMEALFTSEDWDSPAGSARQVLSTLSVALPWQGYMSLQKQLMAKGLIRELEVPAEFD